MGTDISIITAEITPADTLMMHIVAGILTELASEKSEDNLDSLTARINRMLTKYLNETFKNLDPGPVGKKFTQGALDPLLAAETEARMKEMISAISSQLSRDITNLISEATSPENKAKLNSLLTSLLSEDNSAAISAFVNRSLRDIRFDTIGMSIANELIANNLIPAVDSLTRTAVRGIFDEINKDDTAKGFFGDIKHILFLGLGLIGLILGLLFWWNRRKTVNLNRMLINAIEDLDDKTGKDVKKVVAAKARNEGLLPDLDKVLEQEHLLNRKESGKKM